MSRITNLWMEKMEDFSAVVYKLLRENPTMQMQEAFAQAAKMPAKRFYVDAKNAARFVARIDKGKEIKLANKNKIAMFEELHKRWVVHRAERRAAGARVVPMSELKEIINGEAPAFYERMETLRCAFYKYIRVKR